MGKHCPADCSHVTISFPSVPQAQRDIIFELRRIAFDAESDSNTIPGSGTEKRKAMYTKDYKMLGFTVCTWGVGGVRGRNRNSCLLHHVSVS